MYQCVASLYNETLTVQDLIYIDEPDKIYRNKSISPQLTKIIILKNYSRSVFFPFGANPVRSFSTLPGFNPILAPGVGIISSLLPRFTASAGRALLPLIQSCLFWHIALAHFPGSLLFHAQTYLP